MSYIDWIVLACTLLGIVLYGVWKSRHMHNIDSYLLADRELPWYQVGLSVMATQASAITFLSAPGQAYGDGMRFVQFYFGLPLAMIVICIFFIPAFRNLHVYTAYEYLEQRFGPLTRSITALLFLVQRGVSTGITIYAPAIILSTILHTGIEYTTFVMGLLVITYTVYGGTKAVSYTQMLQMLIIFSGLFMAGYMVVHLLPAEVGFIDALHIAGKMGKMNIIDTRFDWNEKYNLWSGIIGGFFLQLSYFGTDQSQVGRYLTGSSVRQSRLGLVMNGLVKIPMQFLILLIGILVFTFYQYHRPPIFFNEVEVSKVRSGNDSSRFRRLESDFTYVHAEKQSQVEKLVQALDRQDRSEELRITARLKALQGQADTIHHQAARLMKSKDTENIPDDTNYVFLHFVMDFLPVGLVGLLIAIIFLAAMGSTASGLNSLASTSVVDFYKRFLKKEASDRHYLSASRWITVAWGLFCMIVALYAGHIGNLLEAVNNLGSLFYGVILGVFMVAFLLKKVRGKDVVWAILITQILIFCLWYADAVAYLWLNLIGCIVLLLLSAVVAFVRSRFTRSV